MKSALPDTILFNGVVHTLDDGCPRADALAVSGNRIMAVGGRDVLALAGRSTRRIDLGGRAVLPGFVDTHFHFYEWAMNLDSIDFSGVSTFGGMMAAIREKAAVLPEGQWILGNGFNESEWPENRMPTRHDLDRAAGDHPVCIWRCDLHLAVASSLALHAAGIAAGTPNPPDGIIERDMAGEPTGVLKELAPELIRKAVPPMADHQRYDNMKTAIKRAHSLGLTGVHDIRLMGGADGKGALQLWQRLHRNGDLLLRCHVALPGEMTDQAADLGLMTGFGDDRLRIGHLKFFADGGMGARTAWVTEKYLDAETGMPLTPIREIEDRVITADRAGLACMVHAVGDRAAAEVIAMYERIGRLNRSQCVVPHRIEHLQMILPADLKRLSRLTGVAASCHPNNLSLDISMIDQCAGERGRLAYNLRGIVDTGIPVMLGSDAPVADPNPMAGIYSAVTRKRMNRTPETGWYPENALSVRQAVKGYTLTPAAVMGQGRDLGSLAPGKLADMVVTDRDPFSVPPDELADITAVMTLFDGSVVYER